MRYAIAFYTILRKEVVRFFKLWPETLLPSSITTILYFIIFGSLIGPRIGEFDGFTYLEFIVPGVIMMETIMSSYANVVFSFFFAKFIRSIDEMLIAPIPNHIIILGYVIGGILRGFVIAIIVTIISLFFSHLQVFNYLIVFLIILLSSALFSLGGFINAIFAKNFDNVGIVPTFVLTPLTFFGGVFYSIKLLPVFWQKVSLLNPILYIVNAFRYGILGVSDVSIPLAFGILITLTIIFYFVSLYLMNKGTGIKS